MWFGEGGDEWLSRSLTLVSRPNPRVLPWTWSPAAVGDPRVVEPTVFTDLRLLFQVESGPCGLPGVLPYQHPSQTAHGDNDLCKGGPLEAKILHCRQHSCPYPQSLQLGWVR